METESRATYGPYSILGTLGKGSFGKVKLAEKEGQNYAIKFLSNDLPPNIFSKNKELLLKEIDILRTLDHPHLVRYVDSSPDQLYTKRSGKQYERLGLVLEYLPSYDLFEVLQQGPLGEELGRTYFHQLIEGLQYLHRMSVVHRDLKPDNILFDQNLNLRITDFGTGYCNVGLSKVIEAGPPTTICGTQGYKCPEMLLSIKYNGVLNDLFAAGILLVNLVTGRSPFNCADPKTGMYKYMANNQHQKFWVEFEKKAAVDPDFKDLVNGMLAFDPSQRLTIAEIKCHPWYNRDVYMGGGTIENLRRSC
jgi:serine/threonine protein kinase